MGEIKEAIEGLREHFKVIAYDYCGDVDTGTAHFQTVEKWVAARENRTRADEWSDMSICLQEKDAEIARLQRRFEDMKERFYSDLEKAHEKERKGWAMSEHHRGTLERAKKERDAAHTALEEARRNLMLEPTYEERQAIMDRITAALSGKAEANEPVTPAGDPPPRPGP